MRAENDSGAKDFAALVLRFLDGAARQRGPTTHLHFPQHCLNFFPLPQGQGSLRPTFGPVRIGCAFDTASLASLTTSEALPAAADVRREMRERGDLK